MIKLVALDLDGTLLNENKEISQRNQLAIQEAIQKGVHVVLCTGRPIMGIRGYLTTLGMTSDSFYCITFNGGLVQTVSSESVLAATAHTKADAQYIFETLYNVGLPVNVIDLNKVYEPTYPADNPSLYPVIIKNLAFEKRDIDTFEEEHQFNKAVCCCEESVLDDRIKQLPSEFFERFSTFKSRPILLEISPKGIDKSAGLEQLCRHLNITRDEVMAMGDEENDAAMIEWAGYGVAMTNATDELKKSARWVTLSNEADGVAVAIEKFILNKE